MNELSCTVVFKRPQDEAFVRKWQVRNFRPGRIHKTPCHPLMQ